MKSTHPNILECQQKPPLFSATFKFFKPFFRMLYIKQLFGWSSEGSCMIVKFNGFGSATSFSKERRRAMYPWKMKVLGIWKGKLTQGPRLLSGGLETTTMRIKHLLNGMILQVIRGWTHPFSTEFLETIPHSEYYAPARCSLVFIMNFLSKITTSYHGWESYLLTAYILLAVQFNHCVCICLQCLF